MHTKEINLILFLFSFCLFVLCTVNEKYTISISENTTARKVSRDRILPELPSYRLPGRFSVRPALRTQGEKGNGHGPPLNSFLKCFCFKQMPRRCYTKPREVHLNVTYVLPFLLEAFLAVVTFLSDCC